MSILAYSIEKGTLDKIMFLLRKTKQNYKMINLGKTLKATSSKLLFHLKLLGDNEKTLYSHLEENSVVIKSTTKICAFKLPGHDHLVKNNNKMK